MDNVKNIDVVEIEQKMTTDALFIAIKAMSDIGALKMEMASLINEATGEPIPAIIKRLDSKSSELMKIQLDKLATRLGPAFEGLSDLIDKLNELHS